MKSPKHIYLVILSFICFSVGFAQPGVFDPAVYKDGIYDKEKQNAAGLVKLDKDATMATITSTLTAQNITIPEHLMKARSKA